MSEREPQQAKGPPKDAPSVALALTPAQATERAEWIMAATRQLRESAAERGFLVTGDWRVTAKEAATLVGQRAGYLANLRHGGGSPVFQAGRPVTYELRELAIWLWSRRRI